MKTLTIRALTRLHEGSNSYDDPSEFTELYEYTISPNMVNYIDELIGDIEEDTQANYIELEKKENGVLLELMEDDKSQLRNLIKKAV